MKHILLTTTILLLTACQPNTQTVDPNVPLDVTDKYVMPSELSDCKVYRITGKNMSYLHVVRCRNSISTKTGSKHPINTTLIEE